MGPDHSVAAVRSAVRRGLAGLPSGSLVLVACSGGADSLALAAASAFVAPRLALEAGAVVVDHGLQAGSSERAARVALVLRERGLAPVDVQPVRVDAGGGPEAAARRARYQALDAVADRHQAVAVLLGHSRDDQAETVLLGLARGSGARSLSSMAPVAGLYHRPLLGLDRATLAAACAAEGLEPWSDPHNRDPSFSRSRVRHAALPALEAALGPGVAAALARSADLLRADADVLDAWAGAAHLACAHPDGGLGVGPLLALPPAVRGRVLRMAAVAAGAPAGRLSAAHVGAMAALVEHWHGQGAVALPGRVSVTRSCGRLLLRRDTPTRGDELGVPGGREGPGR